MGLFIFGIIGAIFCAIIAEIIASHKGRSGCLFSLLGLLLGPLGVLVAALMPADETELEARKIDMGHLRRCSYCAEAVKWEASVCRYCGNALVPVAMERIGFGRKIIEIVFGEAFGAFKMIIVVIIVVGGGLLGMYAIHAFAPQRPQIDMSADASTESGTSLFDNTTAISVTAPDLSKEFDANEVAARNKYANSSIILSGLVENVEIGDEHDSFGGGPHIWLESNSPRVMALFSDWSAASRLHPSDAITLQCIGAEKKYGVIVVASHCDHLSPYKDDDQDASGHAADAVPEQEPSEPPPPAPRTYTPQPARPKGNPASWVTANDYPSSALREVRGGITRFRVSVTQSGQVSGCEIIGSSGSADLDDAACASVSHHAQFQPATDSAGNQVPGSYENIVRWAPPQD